MTDKNYIGMRFGTRVCVEESWGELGKRLTLKCDCGRVSTTYLSAVDGHGCISCVQVKHGHRPKGTRDRTYQSWLKMKDRCNNRNHVHYHRYGGAGVSICDKWSTFEGFLEDMGPRPEGTSIDRIDNRLGYFKENCRWATEKKQARNKRTNVLVTVNGESKCIGQWSEETGLSHAVIRWRINNGWPEHRILEPAEYRKPRKPKVLT